MKLRRSKPFVELRQDDLLPDGSAASGLFLGRLGTDLLLRELEAAGVLDRLADRGYDEVLIRTGVESAEHRLRILPRHEGQTLLELRVAEGTLLVEDPALRGRGLDVLSVLSVHWLSMEDPRRGFPPGRAPLPGQRHPGLGLGVQLSERLLGWASTWGKDALVAIPEYFHNAYFYAGSFRFLSAVRQGRFEALRRDLFPAGIAAAAAAIEEGRVREEPGGAVFRWDGGEMAAPLTPGIREGLDAPEFREAVETAREAVRFIVT
jgi:hypothetical protein